jgi:hypothetical protein
MTFQVDIDQVGIDQVDIDQAGNSLVVEVERHIQYHLSSGPLVVHRTLSVYYLTHPEDLVLWEQMGRPTSSPLEEHIDLVVVAAAPEIDIVVAPHMELRPKVDDWVATPNIVAVAVAAAAVEVAERLRMAMVLLVHHMVTVVGKVPPHRNLMPPEVEWMVMRGKIVGQAVHCIHWPSLHQTN